MLKMLIARIKLLINTMKQISNRSKLSSDCELIDLSTCKETGKHFISIKIPEMITNISCAADEISDNQDLMKYFSPADSRTVSYLANCNKTMLYQEKSHPSYDVIRSKSINGKKTILIRNKQTGNTTVTSLQHFADHELIAHLEAKEAYYLGYLAGQEQTLQGISLVRMCDSTKKNE